MTLTPIQLYRSPLPTMLLHAAMATGLLTCYLMTTWNVLGGDLMLSESMHSYFYIYDQSSTIIIHHFFARTESSEILMNTGVYMYNYYGLLILYMYMFMYMIVLSSGWVIASTMSMEPSAISSLPPLPSLLLGFFFLLPSLWFSLQI